MSPTSDDSPSHQGGELDLDELEALARAATPGPWKSWVEGRDHTSGDHVITTEGEDIYPRVSTGPDGWNTNWQADQDFIAAANPSAILELIARVRDQTP